jgi:glutamate-1-semialdehyde 2,1-aminomutase
MPLSRREFLGVGAVAATQLAQPGVARANTQEEETAKARRERNWTFTDVDAAIAATVQAKLPAKVFDIHAHLYRKRDLGDPCPDLPDKGPDTVDIGVWRNHLGQEVGRDRLAGGLFLPYPVKHGDVEGGNDFLVAQVDGGDLARGLIVVTPDSPRDKTEAYFKNPRIVGFKPYHVFAHVEQTFDAPLEAYLPEWVWAMADAHRAIILLHIVRQGAISDPGNQAAILKYCTKYPNATLLLAHAGRGFHAPNTINALPALKDLKNVCFDLAAICEPDALMAIIKVFGPRRLLYGSDFPVSQQRGKCVTVGDAFSWICPQRIDVDPDAPACHSTLVGLESLRALLLATQLLDLTQQDLENIFFNNAMRLLGLRSS